MLLPLMLQQILLSEVAPSSDPFAAGDVAGESAFVVDIAHVLSEGGLGCERQGFFLHDLGLGSECFVAVGGAGGAWTDWEVGSRDESGSFSG